MPVTTGTKVNLAEKEIRDKCNENSSGVKWTCYMLRLVNSVYIWEVKLCSLIKLIWWPLYRYHETKALSLGIFFTIGKEVN